MMFEKLSLHTSMPYRIKPKDTLEMTLNANGVATVPLPIDAREFLTELDACVSKWFKKEVAKWFSKPNPVTNYPKEDKQLAWMNGRAEYEEKQGLEVLICREFDPGTAAGLEKLFVPKLRASTIRTLVSSANLAYYIDEVLKVIKQGGTKMPMRGQYATSKVTHWNLLGFGFWAHIVPAQGIRSQLALQTELTELGVDAKLTNLPHLVYKPNNGEALRTHTDGPRLSEILEKLEAMKRASGSWPSNADWCREMGLQALVHYEGGDSASEGATFGFGPMTTHKLHVCISALREKMPELYADASSTARDGPAYLKWESHLEFFNLELAANGLGKIDIVPICPDRRCGTFAALWPNGFPHGSYGNRGRRVTTTAPLSIFKRTNTDDRVPDRVSALAELANPTGFREHALQVIKSQTKPFHGGTTHARPDLVSGWYDRERNGAFANIAPTHKDAERFKAEWFREHPEVPQPPRVLEPLLCEPAPPQPPEPERTAMPMIPPYGPKRCDAELWQNEKSKLKALWEKNGQWQDADIVSMAHATAVDAVPKPRTELKAVLESLHDDTTVFFNVQEPWASLIAAGVKCVENRPNAFPARAKWAVIIASKPAMSEAEMQRRREDYRRRLKWSGQTEVVPVKQISEYRETTSQCAVAYARIESFSGAHFEINSIWCNGDEYAWTIKEVVKLKRPVYKGPGVLSVCYLNKSAVLKASKMPTRTAEEVEHRERALEEAAKADEALKTFKLRVRTQIALGFVR